MISSRTRPSTASRICSNGEEGTTPCRDRFRIRRLLESLWIGSELIPKSSFLAVFQPHQMSKEIPESKDAEEAAFKGVQVLGEVEESSSAVVDKGNSEE